MSFQIAGHIWFLLRRQDFPDLYRHVHFLCLSDLRLLDFCLLVCFSKSVSKGIIKNEYRSILIQLKSLYRAMLFLRGGSVELESSYDSYVIDILTLAV